VKIIDLFSKRQKRLRGELPDVYTYGDIPQTLRTQIVYILRDAIGTELRHAAVQDVYQAIHDILCREYGVFSLGEGDAHASRDVALFNYFLTCDELEKALDVIELSFRIIDRIIRDEAWFLRHASLSPDNAIDQLNSRFREHGVGYQFESGQIIRVDSQVMHSEIVKPTLQLLADRTYEGANGEFLQAHQHYRKGRYQECLNDCLKAFESTMKVICAERGWNYNQDDTASKLIDICFANRLVPDFLQSEFAGLRAILESGVPTARNRLSGHGRGTQQRKVPDFFASYILHMTAANILFLIQAERNLP